ncbi:MAG TPA: ABC transporter permease [Spirochaetia bacterium]|nr:ABC transporter permease [Spirochaetia bacterium]
MRIATIMVKEFRQISRDPATLGMLLVVPLFLLLMFGFAISLDVKHIQLAVLDHDRTPSSRNFLQSFLHSEYFDLKRVIDRESQIDGILDEGEALVALVIPRDFGREVANGKRVEVQAIVDGSNGNTAATAIGYVQALAADYSQRAFVRSLERAGATGMKTTIDFRPRVLFNPELRSANFLVPGLIVLILMMSSVLSTTLSIVREKEKGTMEQIAVSPVTPLELIVGKTVPYLLIGLVAAATILATSRFLFGVVVKGSWLDLGIVTLIFLFGCLSFGVLLSTLSDSQQVAFLLSALLTLLPTFILSGFVFPFRNMPVVIRAVSYILPGRYYLSALRAIMVKGVGFWAFGDQVLALVIFALATGGLSVLRLRRQGR